MATGKLRKVENMADDSEGGKDLAQEPASGEDSGDFLSKIAHGFSLKRGVKAFFSLAGIAAAVLGILVTLLAYFYLSSAVNTAKLSTLDELSRAYDALGSAQEVLASASSALQMAPDALNSTADSLDHYSKASASTSASLRSMGGALSGLALLGLPSSVTSGLSDASVELDASAASMKNASASMRSMGASLGGASGAMASMSANFDSARSGLKASAQGISDAFDGAQLGIMLLCGALCLFFVVFILYSIPAAL